MTIRTIFAFLFIILIASAGHTAPKASATCKEDRNAQFYRQMTAKFLEFIYQAGVEKLPYTIDQVEKLMKSTCIETSKTPLSLDDETKDAINYFPEEKRIVIYGSTWDQYHAKFALNDWTIEDYYKMFRIIHHELVPYFTKKSDPRYAESLELYTYLSPPVTKTDFKGTWLYIQKDTGPSFGHYMGKACAIEIDFRNDDIYDDKPEYLPYREVNTNMHISLGMQNPHATIECPNALDVYDSSLTKDGNIGMHPFRFSVFCKAKRLEENFSTSRRRRGEFSRYQSVICEDYFDKTDLNFDKNLQAFMRMQVEYLPNKEIKITYRFFRTNWDTPIFSFSNTYQPYMAIKKKGGRLDRKREIHEYVQGVQPTAYLIQRWVYANKQSTSEQNCALAEKYSEQVVDYGCDFWVDTFNLWSKQYTTLSMVDDVLLAKPSERKNVYCDKNYIRTWNIKTPNDNGCIAISERYILKRK